MSTEDIKKLKLYKILALSFLITTIVISLIFAMSISKNKRLGEDGFIALTEHNKIIEDFKIADEILKLDQQLLTMGNRQNILEKFNSLVEITKNKNLKDVINNRITVTKSFIKAQNENEFSNQELQIQLQNQNKLIDSLVNIGDSLNTTYFEYRRKTERKTDSLMTASKKKDMQLVRKETVKVITFKNSSGNLIHYLGETEGDKAKGNGVGIWNTGSIYRGEWRNNKRHGVGEFSWSDGQKYKGDFVDDIRTGDGIYYWPSGERYEGEFSNNKRDGNGIFYDPDGNVKFNGQWKNDKFIGN